MVFVVPANSEPIVIGTQKSYRYIDNWRMCHMASGELVDGIVKYSDDLILSLVLSYLAPIPITCISGQRTAEHNPPPAGRAQEDIDQGILAVTLTALMTLAKPPTPNNTPAYTKRWKAAMASLSLTDKIPASSWAGIAGLATLFHNVVQGRADLRREIADRVVTIQKTGAENAVLSQLKLVWDHASLKSVLFMDAFIKSQCRALEIPAVLDQAAAPKEKWEAAKVADKNLPYSRVRDPNAHPELHHAHYPDLYYAAIAYAKAHKMMGDNFQVSRGHGSTHITLIEKYITKTAQAELGELTESTREKLAKIGYPIVRRKRRTDSDSEDEEAGPSRRSRR